MGALMNASGHVEGAELRVVKLLRKPERAAEAAGGSQSRQQKAVAGSFASR
jgi:hypothetical protein